ncbi:MAG: hypothetical protein K5869_07015 [Saccharofermentans sp.]|nr:hypothetical protein [Saccharofermentans sp.]
MTEDLRDITSTRQVAPPPGQDTRRVYDSFFAELLLSFITATSLLSCIMVIKGFSEYITVGTYPQLLTLILVIMHTFIRRKWPALLPCVLIHAASSVIFFFAMILIPFFPFGISRSNMFYLGVIVFLFTLLSVKYRLNPTYSPSESQVISFPACIFPICGIFYAMMGRTDLIETLIINTILIAVMYLVMRQIAVFDTRYYHSIRRSSRPAKLLKRQNYLTALGLVGIFAVSLVLLKLLPISVLSNAVQSFLLALIPMLVRLIIALLDLISNLFQGVEKAYETEESILEPDELIKDEPWLRVLGIIIAILILIGLALLIIHTLRMLIRNAPVYRKDKETSGDENIIDTIEDLRPQKRTFLRKSRDFGKGRERRIRKQFYEKTVRAMKKGLPVYASSTPGQIEKVLSEKGDKDISSLRQEYEKVRYGK